MTDQPVRLNVFISAWQMEGFLEKPFTVDDVVSWMQRPRDLEDHEFGDAVGEDRARTITHYYEVDDLSGPVTDLPETRARVVSVDEIACRYEPVGDSVVRSGGRLGPGGRATERSRSQAVRVDMVGYLVRLEPLA